MDKMTKTTRLHAIKRLKAVLSFCRKTQTQICTCLNKYNKHLIHHYDWHIPKLYADITTKANATTQYLIDSRYDNNKLQHILYKTEHNNAGGNDMHYLISIGINNMPFYTKTTKNHSSEYRLLGYADLLTIVIKLKELFSANLNDWLNIFASHSSYKQRIWKHTVNLLRQHSNEVHLVGNTAIVGAGQNAILSDTDNYTGYWRGSVDINGTIMYPIIHKNPSDTSSKTHLKNEAYIPMFFLKACQWQRHHLDDLNQNKLWKKTVQKFQSLTRVPNFIKPSVKITFNPTSQSVKKIHLNSLTNSDFLNIIKGQQIPSDYGNKFPPLIESIINWYRHEYKKTGLPHFVPVPKHYFKIYDTLFDNTDKSHSVHATKPAHIVKEPKYTSINVGQNSWQSVIKQDIHKLAVDYGKKTATNLEKELDNKYLG